MAKTFTRLGKQIAIAVKAGGPEPENNPTLRGVIATCRALKTCRRITLNAPLRMQWVKIPVTTKV